MHTSQTHNSFLKSVNHYRLELAEPIDRLKIAFDIAITGENNCNGKVLKRQEKRSAISVNARKYTHLNKVNLTYHAPVSGDASLPLIMNRGNRIENTHPLQN